MSFYGELQRRNVIRVGIAYLATGWLLLQVASVLLPVFEAPGWVAKAIVLLLALGFLPALIFAWVYELTPEGLRRDVDIEPSESLTRETGKKLNVITILVVVTGVIVTLGSRWFPTEAPVHSDRSVVGNTPTPEEQSIAILPFVNMSAGEDTGYFSDGLTETLLHIVAQNRELKVAARTSSFAFKGKDVDVRKIAQDLNVAHVLEGSVQRSGDRVRITAQLIRAEDGFHVWSGKFDRTLEDIFAIQDEIATRVGTELARSITGDGGQRPLSTHNVAAYDLYLRGLSAMASGSYQALLDAEGFLKRAVAADPDFLEARTSLAVVIYRQVGTGLRSPSSLSDVIAIVERNLELAPNDPRSEALLLGANLSSQFWNGDLDMNAGEEQFLALLRDAGSDVMVRMMYSTTYYEASPKRVEKVLREALEFDPLNADVHLYLGRAIMWQDREDEAIPVLKRALEIEPGAPNAFMSLGDAYGRAGKAREMVEAYLGSIEADPRDPELPARTASKLYELGLLEPADELVAKAAAIAPTSPVTINAQLAGLVARKDHEATQRFALEHIEKNIQNRQWAFPNTVRR
ncbi:MAG: tetratricopeptide repeat protein, partial [Myxococcota bacterium]